MAMVTGISCNLALQLLNLCPDIICEPLHLCLIQFPPCRGSAIDFQGLKNNRLEVGGQVLAAPDSTFILGKDFLIPAVGIDAA